MRRAFIVLILSVFLDVVFGIAFGIVEHCGLWNGLYFATTTASTVGYGDITPDGWGPHLISVAIMLTVIPLFTSVFSLITTALTVKHTDRKHAELTLHLTSQHSELKQHVSEVHSGRPGSHQGRDSESDRYEYPPGTVNLGGVPGHH